MDRGRGACRGISGGCSTAGLKVANLANLAIMAKVVKVVKVLKVLNF
jgi:hypothetical protein